MNKKSGVKLCEAALERLLNGEPHISEHIGVVKDSITPAMVSVEAGFDKGYLKRSREAHMALIARIDKLKADGRPAAKHATERLSHALSAAEKAKASETALREILEKVLTQNLMLVERVRELEAECHGAQRRIS